MRDLARSRSLRRKKPTRKLLLIIIVVVAVVAGFYFYGQHDENSPRDISSAGVVLRDAPNDLKPVSLAGIEKIAVGGVNLTTESANMKDLQGKDSSAVVTRTFGAGAYRLDVDATLPDPVNVSYAVWLVGTGKPLLIDYLRGSGTSYSLGITGTTEKYMQYDTVLITLERTKDFTPEEKVMQGTF